MVTIRTGARLFKAVVNKIVTTKQKITKSFKKIWHEGKRLRAKLKMTFFSLLRKRNRRKPDPILIHRQAKPLANAKQAKRQEPKKNRPHKKISKKQTATVSNIKASQAKTGLSKSEKIQEFYQEWDANWGPILTPLDREFLESANEETLTKVIANGKLTLKSPYLKAVYNGLKDLENISDLLANDELAKKKVKTTFKGYWDRGPEKFSEMLILFHDKGCFPTRFGEKRLSLDPRLIPEWLGFVS